MQEVLEMEKNEGQEIWGELKEEGGERERNDTQREMLNTRTIFVTLKNTRPGAGYGCFWGLLSRLEVQNSNPRL